MKTVPSCAAFRAESGPRDGYSRPPQRGVPSLIRFRLFTPCSGNATRYPDRHQPAAGAGQSNQQRDAVAETRKQKVEGAIKAIKDFHTLGVSLPEKQDHKDAYDQGTIEAEAKKKGISGDTLRKARQFADPKEGCTASELRELVKFIREVQPDQDDKLAVFSKTHIIRLVSVPKRRRLSLQKKAIEEGWSTAKLETEIATRYGTRRSGGRKGHVPRDAIGLLTQIEKMCETWRRWLAEVTPDATEDDADVEHAMLAELPKAIQQQVRSVGAGLAELQKSVTAELKTRRPGRDVRHQTRDDKSAN